MKNKKIKSYCKINLSLKVIRKLKNGYHNISSLITFCKLYDEISVSKINGIRDQITFSGKFKKGIKKNSNTITQVLELMRKKNFTDNSAFKINIKKNIPHGSGLGGGSSNASSLLNYFNRGLKLKLKNKKMINLAEKIGFDVPVSLKKINTFLTGDKKKILRLNKKFNFNLLIVYPNIVCSTQIIYKNNKTKSPNMHKTNFKIKSNKEIINYLKSQKNDLEETVIKIYPKVGKIINVIKSQKGCFFSRITGSGSACIGIFSNMRNAISAKKFIRSKYPKYWCVVSKTI